MKFTRNLNLCNQIIILDGLTGTGKTMFSPIINSFERVQNSRFEYMIEYLCISAKKGKLEKDAASSMLNLLADIKYYDGAISREVNFRPTDLSSVFSNPKALKYIKQLFLSDGEKAEIRIKKDNPILFFVTHQILSTIETAINAFGDRLKIVQMVRHPLYLVNHWESYILMHGNNARDFTLWIDYKGESLPWFTEGWEELYLKSNSYDKSIFSICALMEYVYEYANLEKMTSSLMFIPFEKFVLNPNIHIKQLELFLNIKSTNSTNKFLKRQNVPRISINDGPQKNIYKRYGLKKNKKGISHSDDYLNKLESIKSKSSNDAFIRLQESCKTYEQTFGIWF
jgi:hypothetical protein